MNGSITCGKQASVTICPSDLTLTNVEGEERFVCSVTNEDVTTVGAKESIDFVRFRDSSVVINYMPWTTKGPHYIALSRESKAEILWDKITEDPTMGPQKVLNLLTKNLSRGFKNMPSLESFC